MCIDARNGNFIAIELLLHHHHTPTNKLSDYISASFNIHMHALSVGRDASQRPQ